jgi:thiamine transport system permease protein
LIAHVFFNLPLSVRILLQTLEDIPASNWRLGSQLGMNTWQSFRFIQWPMVKQALPGLSILVFSLCFTSFAIVMTLGGGPAATTIEVAIYQALRFDFDLDLATTLALIQIVFCTLLIFIAAAFGHSQFVSNNKNVYYLRQDGQRFAQKFFDSIVLVVAIGFIFSPLLAIVFSGLSGKLLFLAQNPRFWSAGLNTLMVSIASGLLSVVTAFALVGTSVYIQTRSGYVFLARLVELSGSVILIIPPLVLGTGLFILLRAYTDVFALALPLSILINSLMGLPFAIRVLHLPMLQTAMNNNRLCASLGIRGWHKFKIITWPLLRKPIGLAMAFTSTLAAGDLTIIALFGSDEIKTLPLMLYQLMGGYRLEEAAATALALLVYCLGLFWLLENWIGGEFAKKSPTQT